MQRGDRPESENDEPGVVLGRGRRPREESGKQEVSEAGMASRLHRIEKRHGNEKTHTDIHRCKMRVSYVQVVGRYAESGNQTHQRALVSLSTQQVGYPDCSDPQSNAHRPANQVVETRLGDDRGEQEIENIVVVSQKPSHQGIGRECESVQINHQARIGVANGVEISGR